MIRVSLFIATDITVWLGKIVLGLNDISTVIYDALDLILIVNRNV